VDFIYIYIYIYMSGVEFPAGAKGSIQTGSGVHPVQRILGALSLGVKQQGHEADCSPPSSAEVKNGGAIPLRPHPFIFIAWYLTN
jgi:hypothetical protein